MIISSVHQLHYVYIMDMQWKLLSGYDHNWATDELSLSETGMAGDQKTNKQTNKQNQTFTSSTLLLVTPIVISPCFRGLPVGFITPSIKNWIQQWAYAQKQVISEGNSFRLPEHIPNTHWQILTLVLGWKPDFDILNWDTKATESIAELKIIRETTKTTNNWHD